jgi:iron complex outermembrane receptor protein
MPTLPDLSGMSLEELSAIRVTSVSKRPESLAGAPASVFVITGADIHGAGATSLPEALRLAPTLHVGRFDTLGYEVSARGFNGYETANKLLVLVDGRSVYTPLHSGVFWDEQGLLLEDIDRIEVVSGPGGTLWGANAVNGVINVTTKDARDTVGRTATLTAGSDELSGGARVGVRLGSQSAIRLYLQGFDRRRPTSPGGPDPHDDWDGLKAGFRFDGEQGADTVTVQGDIYRSGADLRAGATAVDYRLRGGNLLGRWSRDLRDGSQLQLQAYYDRNDRYALAGDETLDTLDSQVQYTFQPAAAHTVVAGLGQRFIHDDYYNPLGVFQLEPQRRWFTLTNVFAQDEIALSPRLSLTVGIKVERSSFSGFEYLPNLRLAWRPEGAGLMWAAVSRAARTPSRIERDLVAPGILVKGGFNSEKLIAFEAGYRTQLSPAVSLSVSTFYNLYDDLRTTEPAPLTILPVHYDNGIKGRTYGIEAWGDWQVMSGWRLSAGVTALHKRFHLKPGALDLTALASPGNDPDVEVQLRSQAALTRTVSLDLRARAVDDLPRPAVPGYVAVDARLAWQVTGAVELALSGVNLNDARHTETAEPPTRRSLRRSVRLSTSQSF